MDSIKIVNEIKNYISPYLNDLEGLYIYGSGAFSIEKARDLDVIGILKEEILHSPKLVTFKLSTGIICNLYIIDFRTMLYDIEELKYGGYYSLKFLFGFKKIGEIKKCKYEIEKMVWTSLLKIPSIKIMPRSASLIIETIHNYIYMFQPILLRSLNKYKIDIIRHQYLENFVELLLKDSNPKIEAIKSPSPIEWETSLYRFLREYNNYKSNSGLVWEQRTLDKIIYSLKS